jgi:uncharacterized phiE125 gp8 family phage protein
MLTLVTAPAELPLSLAEVKASGNLTGLEEDQDAVIAARLRAAVAQIDGRDGWLGRCLITQTWTLWLGEFPRTIRVPLPPLQEVEEIRYVDPDGATQTLDPGAYHVAGVGGAGRIVPAIGQTWPATRCLPEAVQVDFTAGFGPDWNSVAEDIRAALVLMTVAAYDGCTSDAATAILMRHRAW